MGKVPDYAAVILASNFVPSMKPEEWLTGRGVHWLEWTLLVKEMHDRAEYQTRVKLAKLGARIIGQQTR